MPLRGQDVARHPVRRIEARAGHELAPHRYPGSIPAVAQVLRDGLDLAPGVTFLVGENGSGKSTLVEAVAIAYGLSPEGGQHPQPALHPAHRVAAQRARCSWSARRRFQQVGVLPARRDDARLVLLHRGPRWRRRLPRHEPRRVVPRGAASPGSLGRASSASTSRRPRCRSPRRSGCRDAAARRRAPRPGPLRDPLPRARRHAGRPHPRGRAVGAARGGVGGPGGRRPLAALPRRAVGRTCATCRTTDDVARAGSRASAQGGGEHRVGAVAVGPQLEAVDLVGVAAAGQHGAYDVARLRDHGRAGRVDHHAARAAPSRAPSRAAPAGAAPGPRRPRACAASATRDVGGARRAPSTARRPAPGRRCRAARRARIPSPASTCAAASGVARSADATSAARCGCRSLATSTAPRSAATAASRAAFPPGPAHRSSHRSSRPSTGASARASATTCEPSSWTPARPSATAATAGVATRQRHGVGRPVGAGAAGGLEFLDGRHAGPGDQRDPRRGVVGLQQRVELVVAADGRGQRLPQRGDDPAGVGPGDGEVRVGSTCWSGATSATQPSRSRRLDRAQDGVDELRTAPRRRRRGRGRRWSRSRRGRGRAWRAAGASPAAARRAPPAGGAAW